ncbi:MAG: crossover junction endodeoxyribonuclease RuvC [Fimbriimonas ginsengisoli]|uniref:Crossover junction endodeoxyribonuclease RuvC n=1 Tax=Fimbriimonas ginsengisoli TaxID=1005039 RepID=A0A931LTN6_FIMGI|nr:crossover junction endodeoxyribonuclease RuvC [Fimbriimonas ginsengisoli]
MRILGIDPGLERIGYGLIELSGSRLTALDYGLLETPRIALPERLSILFDRASELIERSEADAMACERLLFTVNKTTAMDVAKAVGVVLLAASRRGLPCCEYSPPEVKQAVVGNGSADKRQVQFMVVRLLNLTKPPKPDDVADALAVAICHAYRAGNAAVAQSLSLKS